MTPYKSTVLQTLNDSSTDVHAVISHDTEIDAVVLAFRGSSSPRNLDEDVEFTLTPLNVPGTSCSDCKVHAGFQKVYNKIAESVSSAVSDVMVKNSGSSLVVTGHSLGGALAAIASTALAAQGQKATTYTFGEPRNGDAAWASYVNGKVPNYFRVTHYNDGVPQIPPTLLGFQHHGVEHWESLQNGNTASSTYRCEGIEPTVRFTDRGSTFSKS